MSAFTEKIKRHKTTAALATIILIIAATGYPRDVDRPLSAAELEKNRRYYAEAYRKEQSKDTDQATSDYESKYTEMAAGAARAAHIQEKVTEFVSRYRLRDGAMLDIGSGRGYLQDVVENYTGLDISSSVARFYHKKFVFGTATAMPFPDNSFDGGWSIWVLEHVPNPEQALAEMRRVMKNNSVFLWYPAWNVPSWYAQGYDVRPFSDFDWQGKFIKALIPVCKSRLILASEQIPFRLSREAVSRFGPTRLHYKRLRPNYQDYWEGDSDAVNSIDRYEAMLWFRSRGDECLNCAGIQGQPFASGEPTLEIRIHK